MAHPSESTEKLVKEFFSRPGVEGESIDFKRKEIIESKEGRKKLVKVATAIANSGGGCIIVGVGEDKDLADFEIDSEIKQHITQTASSNTEPNMVNHLNIDFQNVLGHNLLRIDIEKTREPIKYLYSDKPDYYIRENDTSKPIDEGRLKEKFENESFRKKYVQPPKEAMDFDTKASEHTTKQINIPKRFVTETDLRQPIVFGEGLHLSLDYGSNGLYTLLTNFGAQNTEEVKKVISYAAESFDVDFSSYPRFHYTIMGEGFQLSGIGPDNFIEDLENWSSLRKNIEDEYDLDRSGYSIGVGAVNIGNSILFISVETRDDFETFKFRQTGLLLPNIPFDDTEIRDYFEKIGAEPNNYQELVGKNIAIIRAQEILDDVKPVWLEAEPGEFPKPFYMESSNPFYGKEDYFEKRYEDLPSMLTDAITGPKNLLYQVSGGSNWNDESQIGMRYQEITKYPFSSIPIIFWSSICYAKNDSDTPTVTYEVPSENE